MRLEPIAALAVLLAMSACGSNGKKEEAKSEQAGSASAAAGSTSAASLGLNPGEWETTIESAAMTGPGIPAEAAKLMKGSKIVTRACMTPEEARRPTADTFGGKMKGDCSASEFSAAGGKLHAVITCSGAGGRGGTTMTTDGSYGGDAFEMQTRMVTDTGRGEMTAESHTTGRRVGECTGKTAG